MEQGVKTADEETDTYSRQSVSLRRHSLGRSLETKEHTGLSSLERDSTDSANSAKNVSVEVPNDNAALSSVEGGVNPTATATGVSFSATVAALTTAFGDPTRRGIYLYVRDCSREGRGVTASEVGEQFRLHPNVARHHLDRLAAGGYLKVTLDRPNQQGAGRPSKRYRASDHLESMELLFQRNDLLVMVLNEALSLLDPEQAESMAERVGESYGAYLASQMSPGAAQRSVRAAMQVVADALTAHGFAARLGEEGAHSTVVASNCPFGTLATTHPVVCAVDRGLVRGLLTSLCGEGATNLSMYSRARGDADCRAVV